MSLVWIDAVPKDSAMKPHPPELLAQASELLDVEFAAEQINRAVGLAGHFARRDAASLRAIATAVLQERERVVAWIRNRSDCYAPDTERQMSKLADYIERGEHLSPPHKVGTPNIITPSDRASRASPQAASRLDHSVGIPCADDKQ